MRSGTCRSGPPTVLLHQTPRSGDEFREVIALLSADHHLLAIDLPGMGHSTGHPDGDTIAAYAAGVLATVNGLGVDRFLVAGHHTGAAVAAAVAAGAPRRISGVVLSSPPWIDAAAREARLTRAGPGVDEATPSEDGRHLTELWAGRAAFYPPGRPDLLTRFLADALLVEDPTAGHRAVTNWDMEPLLPVLRTLSVLLVDHADDPHAHPNITRWRAALPDAAVRTITDGMVPLEFTADAFADALRTVIGRRDPTVGGTAAD